MTFLKQSSSRNKVIYLIIHIRTNCKLWGLILPDAAAAAKLLQPCPTLCDPIDGSPPGSAVPGILQARTLEWVAISFSNAWKWKVKVKSLSCVRLFTTPWAVAHQAGVKPAAQSRGCWLVRPGWSSCSPRVLVLSTALSGNPDLTSLGGEGVFWVLRGRVGQRTHSWPPHHPFLICQTLQSRGRAWVWGGHGFSLGADWLFPSRRANVTLRPGSQGSCSSPRAQHCLCAAWRLIRRGRREGRGWERGKDGRGKRGEGGREEGGRTV